MGDAEGVRYVVDGPVARVTIDREARRNALSWDVVRGLRAAVAAASEDATVRVIVLTGAGERALCAGADLTGMASGGGPVALHEARGEMARLFEDLWSIGKPSIARVRGYALAGGFGLAVACDLVVAADDAVFGTPEVDVGLWPFMITVPLTRAMPPKVALELMLTGRRVGADEARQLGFVNRVVPADELAATLAAKPPDSVRIGLASFHEVWGRPAEEALRVLHPLLSVLAAGDEAAEGLAAFAEKRPPSWRATS